MFLLFLIDLFFIYVLICLFSLGLCSFHVLKHVRLLVSLVFVSTLFLCFRVFGLGFLGACLGTHNFVCACKLEVRVHIQLVHICRLMYIHAYFSLETLIQVFLRFFLYYLMSYAFILSYFYVFESPFLCLIVYFVSFRVLFSFLALLPWRCIHMSIYWCIGVEMQYCE